VELDQGQAWERMFLLYDAKVRRDFHNCEQLHIPSSFGNTYVHDCGNTSLPAVVLFHAFRATSTMWSFLVPTLSKHRRVVAVDYICDVGRSVATKCPQNSLDHAVWVKDLFAGVGITSGSKVTFIGYSYGSFISASVALEAPELVERVVLTAPLATFGTITLSFWWHGLAMVLLKRFGFDRWWILDWMTAPEFDVKTASIPNKDLMLAIDELSLKKDVAVKPVSLSDEELKALGQNCPVTVIMPELETVIKPQPAMERAREAGIEAVMVPNAGHGARIEKPEWLADMILEIVLRTK